MNPRPSFLGSLRLRLLFVAVIVEGVMLTAMIANSVRLLDGGLEAQARLGAERIAPVLHAALVAPLAQHDYATVSAVLSESRSAKTLEYIAVQDDEGRLVASSGWASGDPLPKSGAPSSPSVSGDRYDVGVPVVLAGQELGRLAFGLDLSSVAAARRELVWQGMLIAAAEILLTAGLLAALGFWLTRDLSALTQESEAVSRGDFSRPPLLEGGDDLGRLSCAFNTMTRALRQRFDELAETLRQRDLATQALDAERSRLLSLLSAMGFGVLLADSDDRIVYANPSLLTVFGLPEAPPGADVRILASVVPIGALVPPPGARGGEFVLQDGRTMTYRIFPVPQPDGRPARLSTFADATSSRASARYLLEAKTAAEAAVAAKESFLAAVSHEIRTPMNGIVGMTDLLLDMRLDPDQHRCAAIVRDSAAALLGVVSDILSFTALERGEVEKEESSFVPAETAEIVMGLLASAREAKGLRGSVSTDPSADAVFVADAGKIRQTLVNLVGNAVKFTFQGEIMVRISSSSKEGVQSLRFEVEDTGPGVKESYKADLFGVFSQADAGATRRFGGLGLGLAMSRRLVELMGGRIGLSQGRSGGSVFWFEVPASKESSSAPPSASKRHSVVLCLNSLDEAADLSAELSACGFDPCILVHPAAVFEAFSSPEGGIRPLAAILDGDLDGFEGRDVAAALRAEYGPDVRLGVASESDPSPCAVRLPRPLAGGSCLERLGLEPLASARPSAPPAATAFPVRSSSPGGLRVLVADDDPVGRQVASGLLSLLGDSCVEAENGAKALESIRAGGFDAVLMDVRMPILGGVDACRAVRSLEGPMSGVPILALSDEADAAEAARCRAAGMDGVLAKPIGRAALSAALAPFRRKEAAVQAPPSGPVLSEDRVRFAVSQLGERGYALALSFLDASASALLEGSASSAEDWEAAVLLAGDLGLSDAADALRSCAEGSVDEETGPRFERAGRALDAVFGRLPSKGAEAAGC